MKDCWQDKPDDRPTFQNLRDKLKKMEKQHQVILVVIQHKVIIILLQLECYENQGKEPYVMGVLFLKLYLKTV